MLNPIAKGVDYLQQDKKAFYGIFLPTIVAIESKLNILENHPMKHSSSFLNIVKAGLQRRFQSYLHLDWSEHCKVAVLAAVTHPEYKMVWMKLKADFNTQEVTNQIK